VAATIILIMIAIVDVTHLAQVTATQAVAVN